jgi:hypothetical protein
MGNAKSGIFGTSRNEFNVGDGTDGYKYFYADTSISPNPGLRYNPDDTRWEYSNDGVAYYSFTQASGGTLPSGTTNQLLQYSAGWLAVNDITLPSGVQRDISLASSIGDGGILRILSADGTSGGDGGNLYLFAGDGDSAGDSGDVRIYGGDTGASSSNDGGNILLQGGDANSGDGGLVVITGGNSVSGDNGNIRLNSKTDFRSSAYINTFSDIGSVTTDTGYLAIGSTSSNPRGVELIQSSTDTNSSKVLFTKYRGSLSSPATISNGDKLGEIYFSGYDGSSTYSPIQLIGITNDSIASGDISSELQIKVGNDNSPPSSVVISNLTDTYSLVTITGSLYFESDVRDWEIKVKDSAGTTGNSLDIYSGRGSSSNGNLMFYRGNILYFGLDTTTGLTIHKDYLYFDDDLTPVIMQDSSGDSDATGAVFTIAAQSESNGTTTGGELRLKSGSGTSANGDVVIYQGSTDIFRVTEDDTIRFESDINAPVIEQDDNSVNSKGYDFTIKAQTTTLGSGEGGDLKLRAGNGSTGANVSGGNVYIYGGSSTGSGTIGNIGLHNSPSSWQSGEQILFMADSTTAPTGDPTSGGFMYSDSGAGKWRGSSGTVTTFGPADPHCPNCGRDYALEWQNDKREERLAICMWCLMEQLSIAGFDLNSFIISR